MDRSVLFWLCFSSSRCDRTPRVPVSSQLTAAATAGMTFFYTDPDLNLDPVPCIESTAQDIVIEHCQQKAYALEVWCDFWLTIVTEYSELKNVPWKKIYKRRVGALRFLLSCQLEELVLLQQSLDLSQFFVDPEMQEFLNVSYEVLKLLDRAIEQVGPRVLNFLGDLFL